MLIEGYTLEEILELPNELVQEYGFAGEPIVFQIGSATLLGAFRIEADRLIVQLAHVDGGGEGVLPTLWALAERYAAKQGLIEVEWIVHAVNCAQPNLKLRRMLERIGFTVQDVSNVGQAYCYLHRIVG